MLEIAMRRAALRCRGDRSSGSLGDAMQTTQPDDHPLLRDLTLDEVIRVRARAANAEIVVTDRRLAVANDARLLLNVLIDRLRRIQFDIERDRPATLVVVPEHRPTSRRSSRSRPRSTRGSRRPSW
jgi:hypothetical protein